jgi:hypothetical protein
VFNLLCIWWNLFLSNKSKDVIGWKTYLDPKYRHNSLWMLYIWRTFVLNMLYSYSISASAKYLTTFNKLKIMSEIVHDEWNRLKTIYRLHKLVFDRGDSNITCVNQVTNNHWLFVFDRGDSNITCVNQVTNYHWLLIFDRGDSNITCINQVTNNHWLLVFDRGDSNITCVNQVTNNHWL